MNSSLNQSMEIEKINSQKIKKQQQNSVSIHIIRKNKNRRFLDLFNSNQISLLLDFYQNNPFPSKKCLQDLAKTLNKKPFQIKRWFKLQRNQKYPKIKKTKNKIILEKKNILILGQKKENIPLIDISNTNFSFDIMKNFNPNLFDLTNINISSNHISGKQNLSLNSNFVDKLRLDVGKFLFKNMVMQNFPNLFTSNMEI